MTRCLYPNGEKQKNYVENSEHFFKKSQYHPQTQKLVCMYFLSAY